MFDHDVAEIIKGAGTSAELMRSQLPIRAIDYEPSEMRLPIGNVDKRTSLFEYAIDFVHVL